MNTTIKTILGITVAAASGAVLRVLLAPKKDAFTFTKIKDETKFFLNDFPTVFPRKLDIHQPVGEMTSELIEIDQYETYSSKFEL